MCLPLAKGGFKRGVGLLISVIFIMLVGMAMAGCAIPQIALDDGSAPEPIDLRLCYDWGRPPSTSTSDSTASYFYGSDGRLVFELVSNPHSGSFF